MSASKRLEPAPDKYGVTVRDKLVMLGFAKAQGDIDYDQLVHDALDVMLADRAIRIPHHPIRI